MSAKWRRSQAWDDAFFPRWAWPAKFILRSFSSIALASITLTLVAIYCVLASVPIGMLALIPSYLIYGISLLATIIVVAGLGLVVVHYATKSASKPLRLGIEILAGLALITLAGWLWVNIDTPATWPGLRYDAVQNTGVRPLADFAAQYEAITLRRLPGIEMTEVEFYAWWPLRLLLGIFVVNMTVATLRRIELNFKNIGVLTVHTGIITIAMGSLYYSALKKEGDLRLVSGPINEAGMPTEGPPAAAFYDLIDVAFYASQFRGWEQRPLRGVPRYNEYALGIADVPTASEAAAMATPWNDGGQRPLAVKVPTPPPRAQRVDPGAPDPQDRQPHLRPEELPRAPGLPPRLGGLLRRGPRGARLRGLRSCQDAHQRMGRRADRPEDPRTHQARDHRLHHQARTHQRRLLQLRVDEAVR